QLLKMHLGYGSYAMLMSATLGSTARIGWLARSPRESVSPTLAEAVAAPYPAIWGRTGCRPVADAQRQSKRVRMRLGNGWSAGEAASRAIDAARQGAKVLLLRNTVKAALDTFAA